MHVPKLQRSNRVCHIKSRYRITRSYMKVFIRHIVISYIAVITGVIIKSKYLRLLSVDVESHLCLYF